MSELSMHDALETFCRRAIPEKVKLEKQPGGIWKISFAVNITTVEAHHVMTVIEEIEDGALPLPNMAGGMPGEIGFRSN